MLALAIVNAARGPALAGLALLLYLASPEAVFGQISPFERRLLEFGYNHPLSGAGPTAGYLFFYLNKPNVLREDTTLRLAAAPVYGFGHRLGRRRVRPEPCRGAAGPPLPR